MIPIFRPGGSVPVAYAYIDHEDRERLGSRRWVMNHKGYALRRSSGLSRWLHREVMGLDSFRVDKVFVDHINRRPLDNRKCNLRLVTRAQNSQNTPGRPNCRKSRFRGVSWHAQASKWQAGVWLNGKFHYLGLFADEEAAARIASDFRREHMPFSNEDATA